MEILKSLLLLIAGGVGAILLAFLIAAIACGIIYVILKGIEWLFTPTPIYTYRDYVEDPD